MNGLAINKDEDGDFIITYSKDHDTGTPNAKEKALREGVAGAVPTSQLSSVAHEFLALRTAIYEHIQKETESDKVRLDLIDNYCQILYLYLMDTIIDTAHGLQKRRGISGEASAEDQETILYITKTNLEIATSLNLVKYFKIGNKPHLLLTHQLTLENPPIYAKYHNCVASIMTFVQSLPRPFSDNLLTWLDINKYEIFLEHYDKQKQKDLGIWQTPHAVTNFITRSMRILVKRHFNSDKPFIFDFATGTGTFLVDYIKTWFAENPNLTLNEILTHISGCEYNEITFIYCIMEIDQALQRCGFDFGWDDQLNVINNNTLELDGNLRDVMTWNRIKTRHLGLSDDGIDKAKELTPEITIDAFTTALHNIFSKNPSWFALATYDNSPPPELLHVYTTLAEHNELFIPFRDTMQELITHYKHKFGFYTPQTGKVKRKPGYQPPQPEPELPKVEDNVLFQVVSQGMTKAVKKTTSSKPKTKSQPEGSLF